MKPASADRVADFMAVLLTDSQAIDAHRKEG
jgi:hypothetical protein